jgi:polyisoprenoid-binding protein YceI
MQVAQKWMGSLWCLMVALACMVQAGPAVAEQKLLVSQSEIVFISKQMGVPVEGRFKKFDAQVRFDPAKPDTGNITVEMASASLGEPQTDAELPKPGWFNVGKFAQAQFQSTAIKALGAGKFEVAGKLSIKGAVREVVVPVTLVQSAASAMATGAFVLKRLNFKIGENEWADTSLLADDVQVHFKLLLTGVGKL